MLKYPKRIKKALLLSPAGITDYSIPGTDMDTNLSCPLFCCLVILSSIFFTCKIRVQNLYRCCCFHKMVKKYFGNYDFHLDEDEIKKNKDGSDFNINLDKIHEILGKLGVISLEYPDDLYECIFYLFQVPPPASLIPIEKKLLFFNKIETVFVYGEAEKDFMDKTGAYRLAIGKSQMYKIYTMKQGGHSFALENPQELSFIIGQYFPC